MSLSYGQLVELATRIGAAAGAIASAELAVNLYGKLVHVEEMQRLLAEHGPGVATSVTVNWPVLDM